MNPNPPEVVTQGEFLAHLRDVNSERLAAWEQPQPIMLCEHCGAAERPEGTVFCAPPFTYQEHSFTKPHPYITEEPRKTDGIFHAAELGGEVGEVLNVVKKLHREAMGWRGSRATVEQLAEEIGDVLICLDKLAAHYGIDIEAATIAKFNTTSDKVGLPHKLARHRLRHTPEMAAFGASDAACYHYPGEDEQTLRAAFCHGAEQAIRNTRHTPDREAIINLIRDQMMSNDYPVSPWEEQFADAIIAMIEGGGALQLRAYDRSKP